MEPNLIHLAFAVMLFNILLFVLGDFANYLAKTKFVKDYFAKNHKKKKVCRNKKAYRMSF